MSEQEGQHVPEEAREAFAEALGPPTIPEDGFAALPPGERDACFNDVLWEVGPDWNRLPTILNREDVRDDPVLARYAVRPFLFRHDWMSRMQKKAGEREGFSGSSVDEAFAEYLPAAKRLQELQIAMRREGKTGDATAVGIEIEAANNEQMELRTPATRKPEQLLAYVGELDETYRTMRSEIMQEEDGRNRLMSVYDNVHVNAGVESPQALDRLHQDIQQRRGPYQLLTTVGVLANSTGRVQYFAERWWQPNPLSPVSVEYEDTELGDVGRLQNRLWSFSFHKRNQPEFALMLRVMQQITEEYAEDPGGMRDKLEEATADIIEEMQQIDREAGTDGPRYSELFDVDDQSLALLPDPHRIAKLRMQNPSLPGRWEMYRFAAKRIAELLPQEQEDVKAATDDLLTRMDDMLSSDKETG